MSKPYIMSLDQGTTSCRAIVFDKQGVVVRMAQREFTQYFPQPGWVEHDAEEIWRCQEQVMNEVAEGLADAIAAIGITNQRETVVVWDKRTGAPLHRAIVWQCRRTADRCEELRAQGWEVRIRESTGLVIDPYFSATKLSWLLDHVPGLRDKAEAGEALFGTIDSWLIYKLTNGQCHVTDYSNASRTMMFNIHRLAWDQDILDGLGIPSAMLPTPFPSSQVYGMAQLLGKAEIPIAGAAGDQQAALFGQACYKAGMAKNTYGTGCFLLQHTGEQAIVSRKGLLTTIAWGIDGRVEYALEGSVFTAGAVIQWLRDGLGIIETASQTEELARSVSDTAGVYMVPAFTGMGTPYWDPHARGLISGLTRGSTRAHIVRAALESIAYQSMDVLRVMEEESMIPLGELRVDGGAAANDFLLQVQADILGVPVVRSSVQETTALGAAFLAGLAVGYWSDRSEIAALWAASGRFVPQTGSADERAKRIAGWHHAVHLQLSSET